MDSEAYRLRRVAERDHSCGRRIKITVITSARQRDPFIPASCEIDDREGDEDSELTRLATPTDAAAES
jgi:hypothetical protein